MSNPGRQRPSTGLGWAIALLLLIFATRLAFIDRYPVFIDETVHIHTQERILDTSPLVDSGLGRLGTIWWFFLFQPQRTDPVWVVRVATLIAVLPGLASLLLLGRMGAGKWGMVFAALFALFSTYHYFFERLALADPIAASAVLVAIGVAARLRYRVNYGNALLVAVLMFIGIVVKVNVFPYVGIPFAAAVALRPLSDYRRTLTWLVLSLGTLFVLVVGFDRLIVFTGNQWLGTTLAYIASRAKPAEPFLTRVSGNMLDTFRITVGYLHPAGFTVLGLLLLAALWQRRWYLLLVFAAPMFPLWIGEPQETRYWIVPMALFGLIGAVVLGDWLRAKNTWVKACALGLVLLWGGLNWLPFVMTYAENPVELGLPDPDRGQYILSDATGFGLDQIQDIIPDNALVLGVLANCQGLRYTYWDKYEVRCTKINPDGSDKAAIRDWVDAQRSSNTYVVLEASSYLPDVVEGDVVAVIERPANRANLTIYRIDGD